MRSRAVELRASLLTADTKPMLFDLYGNSRSAGQLAAAVDGLAGAVARAAPRSPTIGLWYTNSFAALEAFLAVEWLGGTRIAVDPSASAAEAGAMFKAAGADIVIADSAHALQLGNGCLVHDDAAPLAGPPIPPVTEVDGDRTFLIYPRAVIDGDLFGIPLSYRNWYAVIDTNTALYRSGRYGDWREESETFLNVQQLMHGTGFLGAFPFLAMGLPQVIADRFDLDLILAAMERYQVTGTMFLPAMLKSLLETSADIAPATRTLRHLLYGGAPVSGDDVTAAVERLGPVLVQVYGRVEGGWPLSILGPGDHARLREHPELLRSCGKPIPEVSARLRSLPEGGDDVGELQIKSDMVSAQYAASDGWCSLGDVMRRDEAGYLYFERRLDRMINTGYHVYPDEIEAVITTVGGVGDAEVVGEPHARWGQMVVAYVVPNGEVAPTDLESTLRDVLTRSLARYKVPKAIRVVDALPGS